MKKSIILAAMALVTLASACQDDKYVANVTELSLVRMDPESGYSGAIVKVLGRNFSEKAKDNVVLIGGKEAKVLDANKWDLTIVVPENDPAEYEVQVTTPKGTAGGIKFLYKEKPEHVYLASIYAGKVGTNASEDGVATSATFSSPEGIIPAGDGSYYILQRGSFAIRKMDSFGRVTTVKTSGAELHHPWQGAVAPSGELYFCNKSSNQLMKMDAAGVVKAVSGFTLQNPMGVKFDADGFGYLSNRNTDGGQVIKFKDDAVVKIYSIPMPTCSAVDAAGRVIVGTEDSGYLYMIDKDGEIKQIAGEGNAKGSKGDGVPGDLLGKSTIGKVNGIWCAKDGALYFCDVTAQAVRKLTPGAGGDYSKGKLETIASGFWPSDVVVSEDCAKIFVTSATTNTIRLIEII
jgi:hypothetical protein